MSRPPLTEARLTPKALRDLEQAETDRSEVTLTIGPKGEVVSTEQAWKSFRDRIAKGATVTINFWSKRIDLNTRSHPSHDVTTRKLLLALRKANPRLADFDLVGGSALSLRPTTIKDFEAPSSLAHGRKDLRGITLYHGTSTEFSAEIARVGLRPRGEGGKTSWDARGSMPSNPRLLYLATTVGIATRAAVEAAAPPHYSVVYKVSVPDPAQLRQDEDAEHWYGDDWTKGATKYSTLAYEGRIAPRFVKPYVIRTMDGWVSWDGTVPKRPVDEETLMDGYEKHFKTADGHDWKEGSELDDRAKGVSPDLAGKGVRPVEDDPIFRMAVDTAKEANQALDAHWRVSRPNTFKDLSR